MRRDPDRVARRDHDRDRALVAAGRGRRMALLVALGMLLLILVPAALAQAAPAGTAQGAVPAQTAQDQPGQCETGNALTSTLCKGAKAPVDAAKNSAANFTGEIFASAGDSALRGLTASVAAAGGWTLEKIGGLITSTTSPGVQADWFVKQYRVMLALAVLIALPMLLLSVAQAIVRQDGALALRAAFIYLPLAGIFSAVGPALVNLLIAVTDWMALAASANAASDAQKFLNESGNALVELGRGTGSAGVPVFGVLVGALLTLVAAFSIWLELLLRTAAIDVSVMFLPLGFAAMVWPATWKWTKRLIEFLLAVIFAKVFIVAIIALAASGLANAGQGGTFEGILAGAALLLLAALSPMALLKLIPVAEATMIDASNQRLASRRASYAGSTLTGSQVVSGLIQSRFRSGGGLQTGGAAAAPAGAATGAAGATVNAARAAAGATRSKVETAVEGAHSTTTASRTSTRVVRVDPGDGPLGRSKDA
jgi:type IV secretion system protein TrbL